MDELKWLIAREIPHLRRYARALTRDPDLADDLVQDCLERALKKRHLWGRRGGLRGWLLRILYRVFLNGAGRRRRDSGMLPFEAVAEPTAPAVQDKHLEIQETAAALDRLPAPQREAILLVALGEVPYDEAAWILGIPIGTLRSRLSRGREALRQPGAGVRPQKLRRVK